MLGVGYLLSMNQRDESTIVEVDGKSLRLTHLSKVMFPNDGFTKRKLRTHFRVGLPWFVAEESLCLLIGKRVQFLQHPVQVFLVGYLCLILDDYQSHIRYSRRLPE